MITKANSLVARLACKLLPRWSPVGVEACRVGQDTSSFVRIGLPWQRHAGGSACDLHWYPSKFKYLSLQFYINRDERERIDMVRISGYRWMFGLFIGKTNYAAGSYMGKSGGFEFFTSGIHIGWSSHGKWGVTYSGSMRDPRDAYTLHVGRFAIGSRTDRWLKRWLDARANRRLEAEMAAFEAANPYPEGYDEDLDPDRL